MEPFRLPLQLLYGELRQGQRPRGCPKRRFKDCIKNNLKHSSTPSTELEKLAQDRSAWRSLTRQAQEIFKTNRRDHLASARVKAQGLYALPLHHCYIPVPLLPTSACFQKWSLQPHPCPWMILELKTWWKTICTMTSSGTTVYPKWSAARKKDPSEYDKMFKV